jgi:hypothetical protein
MRRKSLPISRSFPIDLFIPKPNYSIALFAQISGARRVAPFFLRRGMLAAASSIIRRRSMQ